MFIRWMVWFSMGLSWATFSVAQDVPFPRRAIHVVVPFPPGGSTDRVVRLIAQRLSEQVGQSVVVENKPGAGGTVAAQAVLAAPQDGHTLFVGHVGTHSIDPHLGQVTGFNANKDFRPITAFLSFYSILVVPSSLPVKNMEDLIALAKTKPGGLSFASMGLGTTSHLLGEMFKSATGAPMVHVPMKGSAQAVTETAAARIDVLFSSYLSGQGFLKDGRFKALGYAGPQRSPLLPDVPTLAEMGLANLEYDQWFGFFAPTKVPDAVVRKLNAELIKATQNPEMMSLIAAQDATIFTTSPEGLERKISQESNRYGDVIKRLGGKLN